MPIALVREGFIVLVHDVFLWGSRHFPLETMLETMGSRMFAMLEAFQARHSSTDEIERYNLASNFLEHWVSKYCNILGSSLAGVVSFEDRVALNYLRARSDADSCGRCRYGTITSG